MWTGYISGLSWVCFQVPESMLIICPPEASQVYVWAGTRNLPFFPSALISQNHFRVISVYINRVPGRLDLSLFSLRKYIAQPLPHLLDPSQTWYHVHLGSGPLGWLETALPSIKPGSMCTWTRNLLAGLRLPTPLHRTEKQGLRQLTPLPQTTNRANSPDSL